MSQAAKVYYIDEEKLRETIKLLRAKADELEKLMTNSDVVLCSRDELPIETVLEDKMEGT